MSSGAPTYQPRPTDLDDLGVSMALAELELIRTNATITLAQLRASSASEDLTRDLSPLGRSKPS